MPSMGSKATSRIMPDSKSRQPNFKRTHNALRKGNNRTNTLKSSIGFNSLHGRNIRPGVGSRITVPGSNVAGITDIASLMLATE